MLSEVVNALAVTYFATEYVLVSSKDNRGGEINSATRFITKSQNKFVIAIFFVVNILDRVTGVTATIHWALQGFLHIPKVVFAAVVFFTALYGDVRSNQKIDFRREFLPILGIAIIRVLPIYPFLAVLISFGFLFIITAFEKLGIPVEILNWPIYYGTLYGPFSYIYYIIKHQLLLEKYSLPSTTKSPSFHQNNRWNEK